MRYPREGGFSDSQRDVCIRKMSYQVAHYLSGREIGKNRGRALVLETGKISQISKTFIVSFLCKALEVKQ